MEVMDFIPDTLETWVTMPQGSSGGDPGRFHIAYLGQDELQAALMETATSKGAGRLSQPSSLENIQMTRDYIATYVLLGWENLTQKGQPLDYSVESAKKLLKQSYHISTFIQSEAGKVKNFKEESDLKNSESGENKDLTQAA